MASYQGGIFVIEKPRLMAAIAHASSGTATCVADYHFSDKGQNALSGLHVGQMVLDGKGMIWASSYNHLDRIDPYSMRVTHVGDNAPINYLMASDNGNVWVGYNASVKCYMVNLPTRGKDVDSKEWKIGDKAVSMCDVEGKIWVASGNTCCVLDPKNNSFRFIIPMVTPTNIYYSKLNHEVVMGGNDGFVSIRADLNMPMDEKAQLLLPFADHPTAVYAYRLEGSDHEWHYLDKGNLDISYNGLSYGDYHLTVHVLDGEGNIGDEVYALDISVLPPWYLTIWCKVFYLTLLIVFISWIINSHFVKKQLEEAERQKAEILDQVKARMEFYAKLAEQLKAAVAHRSFEEVSQLVSSTLDVDISGKDALPAIVADQENVSKPEIELDELDKRLFDQITKVVEENMVDSNFNVTMLQEKMGMGNKQLYRKVKALTGQTPVEYIRDMRLRKAAMLLKAGKFSVSEVMYTVGFSNSSYFSKCFNKAFGMTPTEYMKQK